MFSKPHHFLPFLLSMISTPSLSTASATTPRRAISTETQAPSCAWPVNYTLYDFTTFFPAPTSYHKYSVYLNFKTVPKSPQYIECSQSVETIDGFWLVNCGQVPEFSYTWTGNKTLYIKHYLYYCNPSKDMKAFVEARFDPEVKCYTSTGPVRRTTGMTCQDAAEITGEWVRGSEPGPSWEPWTSHFRDFEILMTDLEI